MSFKANLMEKIEIERLARRVADSFKAPEPPVKIDAEAARRLLDKGGFEKRLIRDLTIYRINPQDQNNRLLVFDNEFPIYATDPDDVALRKSPTIKEMLNIGNIFKILNDKDVLITKKEASVQAIKEILIDRLDLTHGPEDIEKIADDGIRAYKNRNMPPARESLELLAYLLEMKPLDKPFAADRRQTLGRISPSGVAGPVLDYGDDLLRLIYFETLKGKTAAEQAGHLHTAARGEIDADADGETVFARLNQHILNKNHT